MMTFVIKYIFFAKWEQSDLFKKPGSKVESKVICLRNQKVKIFIWFERPRSKKILSIFSPIIPHFTSECLTDLGKNPFQEWPSIDKKMLENKLIEYVIQFNGKKRATIVANKDITEREKLAAKVEK